MLRVVVAVACSAALALAGCGQDTGPRAGPDAPSPPSVAASPPAADPSPPAAPAPAPTPPTASDPAAPATPPRPPTAPTPATRRPARDVLAVSVDGLNTSAITGPAFERLLQEGVGTLNARTEVEQTVTLPNHAGMLTGRRIEASLGGHGVTWNEEIPGRTVPGPDGGGVASVFDVVHDSGGSTALFAGKDKFATFDRSWPGAIDAFEVEADTETLTDAAIEDLTTARRRFTFLHLALPDLVGHDAGWLSPAYDEAVAETDRLLGEVLAAVDSSPRLSRRLVVVLTADHGGPPGLTQHDDAGDVENYRVPFLVWGRGIEAGDLYERNPDYRDPGSAQPSYDGRQPVRNGDLANLSLELLGLGPVPGSELDAAQDLDVEG